MTADPLPAPLPNQRRRRRRRQVTQREKRLFLEALAKGYTVTHASLAAGVRSRARFYEARAADPEFAAAWEEACQQGTDALEDELRRAAEEGWKEVDEVYEDGKLVRRLVRQRRDPRLLKWLREWRRPPATVNVTADLRHPHAQGSPALDSPTSLGQVVRQLVRWGYAGRYPGWLVEAGLRELAEAGEHEVVKEALAQLADRSESETVDGEATECEEPELSPPSAISAARPPLALAPAEPPPPLSLAELAELMDANRDITGRPFVWSDL